LMPFCADATAISMEGGNENAAYRLAAITDQDVLLAISLPRYSLDTLQLARFANARGAPVLAITDSPASPLTAIAEHGLFAPADHPVLTSSRCMSPIFKPAARPPLRTFLCAALPMLYIPSHGRLKR